MYSQGNEEKIILEIFKDRFEKNDPGFLVDCGAYDGTCFSNSLRLIELGWSALLIEPSPAAFIALREKHKDNPRVQLMNAAVGTDHHLLKFFDCPDALATTEESNRQKWERQTKFTEHWIMPVSPMQIIGQFGQQYDLCLVDTEGNSTDIFFAMLSSGYEPRAWVIEHDGRHVEICGVAEKRGYHPRSLNGNNVILCKP